MSSGGRTFQNGDYTSLCDMILVPKSLRTFVDKDKLIDGKWFKIDRTKILKPYKVK